MDFKLTHLNKMESMEYLSVGQALNVLIICWRMEVVYLCKPLLFCSRREELIIKLYDKILKI
jgi:hypothetical protein